MIIYQNKITKKIYTSDDIYLMKYYYRTAIEGLKVIYPTSSNTINNYYFITHNKNLFDIVKLTSKLTKIEYK